MWQIQVLLFGILGFFYPCLVESEDVEPMDMDGQLLTSPGSICENSIPHVIMCSHSFICVLLLGGQYRILGCL